jgi:hypothetical protein
MMMEYCLKKNKMNYTAKFVGNLHVIVCLFVFSRMSNFSAIWRLSPLVTGLQIWPMLGAQGL